MKQSKSRLGNVVKTVTNPVFRLAIYVLKSCDLITNKGWCSHLNLIDSESQLEFQSNLCRTSGCVKTLHLARQNLEVIFGKNELVQYWPCLPGRHNIGCQLALVVSPMKEDIVFLSK